MSGYDWNYKKDSDSGPKYWNKKYPSCALNNQSPINIDTEIIQHCDTLCNFTTYYNSISSF